MRLLKRYHLAYRSGIWLVRSYYPEVGQERPSAKKEASFGSTDREKALRRVCHFARVDDVRGRTSCTYVQKTNLLALYQGWREA